MTEKRRRANAGYADELKREAVAAVLGGEPIEGVAARLGVQRVKSIGKWVKLAQASQGAPSAPVGFDPGAAERARQVVQAAAPPAQPAAPEPAVAPGAPPARPDPADEPLNLGPDEVLALADYLARLGDAAGKRLIWRRWDLEVVGLDKGEQQLVRVFAKRISRAVDRVTDGAVSNPLEFLCCFAAFLMLPRAASCLLSKPPASAGAGVPRGAGHGQDAPRPGLVDGVAAS